MKVARIVGGIFGAIFFAIMAAINTIPWWKKSYSEPGNNMFIHIVMINMGVLVVASIAIAALTKQSKVEGWREGVLIAATGAGAVPVFTILSLMLYWFIIWPFKKMFNYEKAQRAKDKANAEQAQAKSEKKGLLGSFGSKK